jgi:rhodanese-related sulfurtransferase
MAAYAFPNNRFQQPVKTINVFDSAQCLDFGFMENYSHCTPVELPLEAPMLTPLLKIASITLAVTIASPAWSYDAAMAESYASLFAPVTGAQAGKAMHLMKPETFVDKVLEKAPLVVLDVRTPAETAVYTSTLPGTLVIPLSELFMEANLARIPTDKTVVVVCKSGTRAAAAGTALRHIGFDNVYVLKGGFKALAGYMGPKEANTPPAAQPAQPAKSTSPANPHTPGRYPLPAPFPPRPAW